MGQDRLLNLFTHPVRVRSLRPRKLVDQPLGPVKLEVPPDLVEGQLVGKAGQWRAEKIRRQHLHSGRPSQESAALDRSPNSPRRASKVRVTLMDGTRVTLEDLIILNDSIYRRCPRPQAVRLHEQRGGPRLGSGHQLQLNRLPNHLLNVRIASSASPFTRCV